MLKLVQKRDILLKLSRMRSPSPSSTPRWHWPREAHSSDQTCCRTKRAPVPPSWLESKTCRAPKLWTTSPHWTSPPRAWDWARWRQRRGQDWWPGWIRASRSGRISTGGKFFEHLPKSFEQAGSILNILSYLPCRCHIFLGGESEEGQQQMIPVILLVEQKYFAGILSSLVFL